MKKLLLVALLSGAALAHAQTSPAKKELVAKVLQLQQPGIDVMARTIAERPAIQLMQAAQGALRTQVPADKREAAAKTIEADVKKFVEEATAVIRDRSIKLAPSTVGPILEEKFTEDELKQLVAWLESPVNKKFQQAGPEMQSSLVKQVVAETSPVLDPKLRALQDRMRTALGLPADNAPKAPAKGASK